MSRALKVMVLGATLLAWVAGCADQPPPAITVEGELLVYIQDGVNGQPLGRPTKWGTYYAILDAAGRERPLQFANDPDLLPGTHLRVSGLDLGDAIEVDRFELLP
jgi:hypothetical protein